MLRAKTIPFRDHLRCYVNHVGEHLADSHGSKDGHEKLMSFVPVLRKVRQSFFIHKLLKQTKRVTYWLVIVGREQSVAHLVHEPLPRSVLFGGSPITCDVSNGLKGAGDDLLEILVAENFLGQFIVIDDDNFPTDHVQLENRSVYFSQAPYRAAEEGRINVWQVAQESLIELVNKQNLSKGIRLLSYPYRCSGGCGIRASFVESTV